MCCTLESFFLQRGLALILYTGLLWILAGFAISIALRKSEVLWAFGMNAGIYTFLTMCLVIIQFTESDHVT